MADSPTTAANMPGFRPPSLALATIGLALASFMQVLDTTIANVSLPAISGNLGASANQATWVITSFAVSNAIALPLTGFMVRRYGERKLFMWATLAFVIASFLCGIANSMGLLVVARALQGFVAGPMYPVTQALLISIYPPHKRGQAIALLAMVTVVAPIAGPILGGWITDNYSWEWIFFINIPIGILPVLLTPFVGLYAARFDLRMVASIAFVAMAATSFLRAGFNLDVDFEHVAFVQLLQGLGVALFFMPVLTILLSDLEPHEIAAGSGLATFVRTLGGSFAASLTTWGWNQRGTVHHAHLTEHISATDPGMVQTVTALGQGDLQLGAMVLDRMIAQQAAQIGFNEIFHLLGILFLVVIAFVWIAKPPFAAKAARGAAAGGH